MEQRTWRFGRLVVIAIKATWCGANVLVLGWWIWLDSQRRFEEQVLILIALIALSFPLGWLFYVLIGSLDVLLNRQISASMLSGTWTVVLSWGFFFLTGYLQWFKLAPYLVRKVRAKRFASRHKAAIRPATNSQ